MVGAGQLARMTHQAAISLGTSLRLLADTAADSAALVAPGVELGDYHSLPDLLAFSETCDVVTFDHEHVPNEHLRALVDKGIAVRPGPQALRYAQDKAVMRAGLSALGVPVPAWAPVADGGDVTAFAARHGWPVVLKAVRGRHAAAGRGARCTGPGAGRGGGPVAVRAGRRLAGGADRAARRDLPRGAGPGAGDGRRPGGGGPGAGAADRPRPRRRRRTGRRAVRDHRRPDGQRAGLAAAQQRALDDRGGTHVAVRAARARGARPAAGRDHDDRAVRRAGQRPRRRRHGLRPGRAARPRVRPRPGRPGAPIRQAGPARAQARARDRAGDRPGRGPAPGGQRGGVPARGAGMTPAAATPGDPLVQPPPADPLVGVVMGSDSDWPTMAPAAEALAEFGVACEVRVVSAHRTPRDMLDYGAAGAGRGLRVIVAGAVVQ